MHEDKFKKLIDTKQYQVFLFYCPANVPFAFATHPWFVINKKGSLQRWEICYGKSLCKTSWGHLHLNYFPLFSGINIFPYFHKYYWKGKLLGHIEGDDTSIAKKVVDFIEKSNDTYPYNYKYSLRGPNSNTYVQWVINSFPGIKLKLPYNSIGKNYKVSVT
jgi:Protein of unknown function (DUF3750)